MQQEAAALGLFQQGILILSFCGLLGACSSTGTRGYSGVGRDSVDEKTLAEFAPPPLEPETSRNIQSLLDIRSPGLGMLSAKKNNLYFSWRVTGTSQVWKLQNPKGFPQQMTGGEDSTSLEGLTADDQWLILSRDRNGEENPGLYLQKTSGGPLKVIQHKTKVQTFFEFVSDDSKWIYYRSNDVKPDSFALYRYGIETGKSELLFSQDGYWVVADYRDDGRLLMAKVLSNFASEYYEFNPASKELKPVIGQGEKEDYTVQYGAADGTYLVLTPKLGEFKRLYSWDGKKLSPVTPNLKWNVAGFSIDHHRTKLTYEVNEGGYSKVHALDARTLKPISFPRFPNADNVYVGSFSKDGKMIMVGVETASAPRTSYSYSFESGVLTQWALPSAPEVDLKTFAKASLENYVTRDGVKIPMFVRRPPQCMDKKRATPCPVVVHFHGGPEAQTTAGFSVFAQMFIDEGVVFVEPNVRGSDGYGKTWLHSDDGAERLKVITDIEDASIFIKKNWAIQGVAPKVGVMGWSYGGYSTLMAMTQFAGAYDAGVSLVGMSNLVTFLNNTAPYRRQLRTPEYGDPEKDKEALIQLSPITYLDRVRAPLMIIQGATDPRVPAGEAIQMHKALKSKGIESPLIIFADEGHGAGKRSNKVLELGHALAFLKKNLK